MTEVDKKIKEQFGKKILFNETLSKYSWFNIGGKADILFRPDNIDELSSFFKKNDLTSINILGAGSNTLIRDGGVKNVTIKLSSKFSFLKLLNNNIIEAGAATLDKKLSNYATENSLSGLEFLSGIPGSVGGAIKMNSGCFGKEISEILYSIKVIDLKGRTKEILAKDIKFFYRGNDLPNDLIITSAQFVGKNLPLGEIRKIQEDILKKKKLAQPSQIKTGGSTFKNPLNQKAWELINKSGCNDFKVGDAKISEKHCNFFINNGKATSNDIEKLIAKVQKKVLEKTNVKLELEIKIIGYDK